jgi:hypothetical protein
LQIDDIGTGQEQLTIDRDRRAPVNLVRVREPERFIVSVEQQALKRFPTLQRGNKPFPQNLAHQLVTTHHGHSLKGVLFQFVWYYFSMEIKQPDTINTAFAMIMRSGMGMRQVTFRKLATLTDISMVTLSRIARGSRGVDLNQFFEISVALQIDPELTIRKVLEIASSRSAGQTTKGEESNE